MIVRLVTRTGGVSCERLTRVPARAVVFGCGLGKIEVIVIAAKLKEPTLFKLALCVFKSDLIYKGDCGDARKSLTRSHKSSTLEAARTFVLIRSTTRWDRPLAPPN
jgi:hypothetical protein